MAVYILLHIFFATYLCLPPQYFVKKNGFEDDQYGFFIRFELHLNLL